MGKKINGVLVKQWLYADDLRIVAELDGTGNVVSRFAWADGLGNGDQMVRAALARLGLDGAIAHELSASSTRAPAYVVRGAQLYRIVADHLGTPRLLVNVATGAVADRLDLDEWGQVLSHATPDFVPLGFASGLVDSDTGFLRFGARDYDSTTGRWTSTDPILFDGDGANLFVYVLNDPINEIDSTGQGFLDCGKAIADYVRCKSGDDRSADNRQKEREECGGGDRGHKKAQEQKENRCEGKKQTMIRACKDPEVYGPFLIVGVAAAVAAVASGAGAGVVLGAAAL